MSKVIGSARAFHHGIEELIGILNVRQLGDDLFEGASVEGAVGRVFGGQVVAQALGAAEQTVDPSKVPHSLHAYFMRAGNAAEPIRYRVERDRDGRNFSTRRVVALQREQPILSAMVNFQIAEGGPSHQIEMPDVKGPDELPPRERTVRLQNIWLRSRRRLAECGPRLGVDVRRQACGVASADIRWSLV